MIIPTQNQRASNNTWDHLNVKQSIRNSIGCKKDHSLSLTNTTIKQKHSSRKLLHVKLQQNKIKTRRLRASQSSISRRHSTFHPCFQKRYQNQTKKPSLFVAQICKQTSRPIYILNTTIQDYLYAKVIPILVHACLREISLKIFCCSRDVLLETYFINVFCGNIC